MSNNHDADQLWATIQSEATLSAHYEPLLDHFLQQTVLDHPTINGALAFHLAHKLDSPALSAENLFILFRDILTANIKVGDAMCADLEAYYERDPACVSYLTPFLYYKGFHIIQSQRLAHCLWQTKRHDIAYFLQNRVTELFDADIHPAARIGKGVMLDHGNGIVVGETAIIGNNVSLLHGITLGGVGQSAGERHPKVDDNVLIGAHATILGNIHIGKYAKIGAGSVVLEDVPPYVTVVGVPAKIVYNTP